MDGVDHRGRRVWAAVQAGSLMGQTSELLHENFGSLGACRWQGSCQGIEPATWRLPLMRLWSYTRVQIEAGKTGELLSEFFILAA
ncbi:hypothetical protein SDJN03_26096, partial [Cucurbita argyrosperma subsp. sororia]